MREPELRATVARTPGRGYAWRLREGALLVAETGTTHATEAAAHADLGHFRQVARTAAYVVLRVGLAWTWQAWHDGALRARGAVGFATEADARSAAHRVRDTLVRQPPAWLTPVPGSPAAPVADAAPVVG